jgi:type IV pilus assembly protein PilF
MLVRIAGIFLVSLLVGCVTVTEQPANNQFDKIKAAEARISLGLNYLESRDMIRARENLEKAVSYAPKYYRSLIAMAHLFIRKSVKTVKQSKPIRRH